MFEPQAEARLFTIPIGADMAEAIADGLLARVGTGDALARCHLIVATGRLKRRLTDMFRARGVRLMPKMTMLDALAAHPALPEPGEPLLARQLRLTQLVRALLEAERDLAPPAAAFDLAGSLLALLDEMAGEDIPLTALDELVDEQYSAHWQRALTFLRLLTDFSGQSGTQARLRALAALLGPVWEAAPPQGPLLMVGSTGSRAGTAAMMAVVSRLPNGAVILPGVDPYMPASQWEALGRRDERAEYDHPQSGFARLAARLGVSVADLPVWAGTVPVPARAKLMSLALRPPPVTDHWLREAPKLAPELGAAFENLTLLTADSPREEAESIAYALRAAAADGQRAALITPDRDLARQVTAALDRWRILPDDSAGTPLQQTPTGLFLRLVLDASEEDAGLAPLVALLKHPFTWRAAEAPDGTPLRGLHLRRLRALEKEMLRGQAASGDWPALRAWAEARGDEDISEWVDALETALSITPEDASLAAYAKAHLTRAEALYTGLGGDPEGLWQDEEGALALALLRELIAQSAAAGPLTPLDYSALFHSLIAQRNLSASAERAESRIKILGTLEARVAAADLIILGGLNDGIWPMSPMADPWINRQMRRDLGLPLPERQIGLSAHDFSQASGAAAVILSRAARTGTTPQIASRWLIRLENLVKGIEGGKAIWQEAENRGKALMAEAAAYHATPAAPRAPRPAPSPPLAARPAQISVTRVEKLGRDPYAIYARYILRLKPLPPLGETPDQILRGTLLHGILERFVQATTEHLPNDAEALLTAIAEEELQAQVPWTLTRTLWRARLESLIPLWIAAERDRRERAKPLTTEVQGQLALAGGGTLIGTADRIDGDANGLVIYDYKTSGLPTVAQLVSFDHQVALETAMASRGAFDGVPAAPVIHGEYCSLTHIDKGALKRQTPPEEPTPDEVLARADALMTRYLEGAAYVSRLWPSDKDYDKDYDHLARFGEWSDGDPKKPQKVGP
ncbi:double-strand break repair protein AddB [Paracoccaceae bacterium GXU_MW_L88]